MGIREDIEEQVPGLLFLAEPEYDEAILGIMESYEKWAVAYDLAKLLTILCRTMPVEEAREWYEYNILGAYMGEHTPIFVTTRNFIGNV
jgi:hypothetical protein